MHWFIIYKQTTLYQNHFCDKDRTIWLPQNDVGCDENVLSQNETLSY